MNKTAAESTENSVELSVIIGFKNWGIDRLLGAVRSIKASHSGPGLEIIIVDYGSELTDGYDERISSEGARYIYVETDGVWSRSRALNIGLGAARGQYLITTDSDMVFSPGSIALIHEKLRELPGVALLLQCRDLPEGIDHSDIEFSEVDWGQLETISRLRPRWGMGGMIAFESEAYYAVRGLDERMEIYGGEDIDLAKRLARAGYQRVWLSDSRIRMYHVWHEPSRATADATPEGRAAISRNREIHTKDESAIRNLQAWQGRPKNSPPLVTVAISTFNRESTIRDAVFSVIGQSFQDWELIVVDDGSTDNTAEVVASISDPRIRLIQQENSGIASARNLITREARGRYIAVHDDDDIMLPHRLESCLAAIKGGVNGAYGGWINFDNQTGDLHFNPGKAVNEESILFNRSTFLHPTLMVERWIFDELKYDSSMRSGSDYNLAVRMVRSGARLVHCGDYLLLRRIHDGQITATDGTIQKSNGAITSYFGRSLMEANEIATASTDRGKKDYIDTPDVNQVRQRVTHFLPDHLVRRTASLTIEDKTNSSLPQVPLDAATTWEGINFHDNSRFKRIEFSRASLETLTQLTGAFPGQVEVRTRNGLSGDSAAVAETYGNCVARSDLKDLVDSTLASIVNRPAPFAAACCWESAPEDWDRVKPLANERVRIRSVTGSVQEDSVISILVVEHLERMYQQLDLAYANTRPRFSQVIGLSREN